MYNILVYSLESHLKSPLHLTYIVPVVVLARDLVHYPSRGAQTAVRRGDPSNGIAVLTILFELFLYVCIKQL